MSRTDTGKDFQRLFLEDTPLIDVRAEIEYDRGSFPTAQNMPILNTQERVLVGTCYKESGQQAAVSLGHKLVGGPIKAARIARWCEFVQHHPGTHVFCWRGGMRSNLAAQWMAEAGSTVPVITGGYKALRRYLMTVTEDLARSTEMLVIGGRTGTAKTPLLQQLATGIDLEKHAHHRGSSFGRHATSPPVQVDFEHRLGIDLLRVTSAHPSSPLFFEDESQRVGAVSIPAALYGAMCNAPLVIVDMPLEFRVERIYQEYVVELQREYQQLAVDEPEQLFRTHLLDSLERIQKRLGMARYRQLRSIMEKALDSNAVEEHQRWIALLLQDYYDPMYQYQLAKSVARVVFSGDYEAVLQWCLGRVAGDK
jgi:tRNA 2-selenouridine synthase